MLADTLLAVGLGGIFLSLALLLATIGVITSERAQVGRSLAAVRAVQATSAQGPTESPTPFSQRVVLPAVMRLARIGRRLTPIGQNERIRRRLELAGSPVRWDVERVVAFKALGLLAFGAAALFGALALAQPMFTATGVAVAGALVGFYAPDLTLSHLGAARQQRMQRDLPDALDLLTISVEAGLGFDAALSQVARNTDGHLAAEFFRMLQEMQIGLGRIDAFRAFSERTDLPELRSFVTAMIQADVFGIPIANVLRVQAKEMRIKRMQRAEEQAQKVPVKILFPLIFCILPCLFVIVVGPAGVSIFRNLVEQ